MNASEDAKLAVIQNDMNRVKDDLKDIKESVSKNYVTQEEFKPIRMFVYGIVALSLLTLGTALFKVIIP